METQDHIIIPKRKHSVIVISPSVSFDDDHMFWSTSLIALVISMDNFLSGALEVSSIPLGLLPVNAQFGSLMMS